MNEFGSEWCEEDNMPLNIVFYKNMFGQKTMILQLLVHLSPKSVVNNVVALDISKAFDRVWHQGLISKVKSYGVGNSFIR